MNLLRSSAVLSLCFAVMTFGCTARDAPGESPERSDASSPSVSYTTEERFLAQVVSFRSLAVQRPEITRPSLVALLKEHGDESVKSEHSDAIWQQFFASSIIKIGRVASSRPISLYYNPVLDIGLVVTWTAASGTRFTPTTLSILPCEALAEADGQPSETPAWLLSRDPPNSLAQLASARLSAFATQHPLLAKEAPDNRSQAATSASQRIAVRRLLAAVSSLEAFESDELKRAYGSYATQKDSSRNRNFRPLILSILGAESFFIVSIEARNPRLIGFARFARQSNQIVLKQSREIEI